jgi:hypothetical protein
MHPVILKVDKLYMLLVGILAASASFWLLMYAPRSLHAFNVEAAAAELEGRIELAFQLRMRNILNVLGLPMLEVPTPAYSVAVLLALCGGFLSECAASSSLQLVL